MKPKLRIYYKIKITLNDLIESLITAQAHANYQKSVQLTILTLTLVNHGKRRSNYHRASDNLMRARHENRRKITCKDICSNKILFPIQSAVCLCRRFSVFAILAALLLKKNHKYFEKFYEIFIVFIPPRYIWQSMVPCPHFYFFLVTWHHLVTRSVDIAKWWLVKMPLEIMIFMKSQIPNFTKKNRRSSLCPCANDLWLLFLRFWRETVRPRLDSYSCRARYHHVTVPERYNQHSQCAMIKNIRQFLINHSKSLKLWDAII